MTQRRVGMLMKICFQAIPISFVVTNFFTVRTDGNQSAQGFYFSERFFDFHNVLFLFVLKFLSFHNFIIQNFYCSPQLSEYNLVRLFDTGLNNGFINKIK